MTTELPDELVAELNKFPGEWITRASCRPGDDWFPEKGTISHNTTYAVLTCQSCDVRTECLAYALANDETEGIWGGLTPKQRGRLGVAGAA